MSEAKTRNQYFAALSANILSLGVGASISWSSPYLSVLQGQDSPLGAAITPSEASWIGSFLAIGALIGSFFYGWLSEQIGRFWSLISAAIPQMIWWLIIIHATSAQWLFLGRFLAGFSAGGSFTLIPLYVTEISQDKIRGSLGAFFILSTNLGMLLIYIAGNVFDYYTTPKVMMILPVTFVALFSFLPETPIYLLRTRKTQAAEKSLIFLRGCEKDKIATESIKHELEKMMTKLENDDLKKRGSCWREFRDSSAARKAVLIGIILISVNQLSGFFTFLSYTADIFVEAGSSLSPNLSAIIVGSMLFSGSLMSLTVVDKFPRKLLYSITTVANLVGLFAMAIHSYYSTTNGDASTYKFVPILSLSLIIFACSAGRLPLTYILMTEIMPQNIRSFGVSICTTLNWLHAFIMLRFYSTAVEILSFHWCMLIFSLFACFGLIFVLFYVPETKNRSFDEIEKSLMNKNQLSAFDAQTAEETDRL